MNEALLQPYQLLVLGEGLTGTGIGYFSSDVIGDSCSVCQIVSAQGFTLLPVQLPAKVLY